MAKHQPHSGPVSPPKEVHRGVHIEIISKAVADHERQTRRAHFCIVLLFLIFIIVVAF